MAGHGKMFSVQLQERICLVRVRNGKTQLPSHSSADAVSQDQEDSETEVDPQATAALLASTPLASGPVIWPRPPAWALHKAPHTPSGESHLINKVDHDIPLTPGHTSRGSRACDDKTAGGGQYQVKQKKKVFQSEKNVR